MWPDPIQGSLVKRTSPSRSVCGGNFRRKCLIDAGSVPMKDGMLLEDCARERPAASVSTTAKSLASRTRLEKEARTKVAAASSTALTRRVQMISSWIGLMLFCIALSRGEIDAHGQIAEHAHPRPLGDDQSRFP